MIKNSTNKSENRNIFINFTLKEHTLTELRKKVKGSKMIIKNMNLPAVQKVTVQIFLQNYSIRKSL